MKPLNTDNSQTKLREDFAEFYQYITNEKNWKKGYPVWKDYAYLTVYNAIWHWIEENTLFSAKDKELVEEIEELIEKHGDCVEDCTYLRGVSDVLSLLKGERK